MDTEREHQNTVKRVLKDGTIKTYKYQRKYDAKTEIKHMGKSEVIDLLRKCNDPEIIQRIR